MKRVREICGIPEAVSFFKVCMSVSIVVSLSHCAVRQTDVRDKAGMERVFATCPPISACIHFAALKAVGESVAKPLLYYENNIGGTISLVQLLSAHKVKRIGEGVCTADTTVLWPALSLCVSFSLMLIALSFLVLCHGVRRRRCTGGRIARGVPNRGGAWG